MEIGQTVTYPTGRGILKLLPDARGVCIVEEDGEYKRVAAEACEPVPGGISKAIGQLAAVYVEPGKYVGTKTALALFDHGCRMTRHLTDEEIFVFCQKLGVDVENPEVQQFIFTLANQVQKYVRGEIDEINPEYQTGIVNGVPTFERLF